MVFIKCPQCGKEGWCPMLPLEVSENLYIKPVALPLAKIVFYCKCKQNIDKTKLIYEVMSNSCKFHQ